MSIHAVLSYLRAVAPYVSIIDIVNCKAENEDVFEWGYLRDEDIEVIRDEYMDEITPLAKLLGVEIIEFNEAVREELINKLDAMTKKVIPGLTFIELEFKGVDEGLVHETPEELEESGVDCSGGDIISYHGRWITYKRVLELFMGFKVHPDFVRLYKLELSAEYPNRIVFDVTHG
jgi:hypothetical protein